MTADDIQQFLLIRDFANGTLQIIEFGTDEQAALSAYEAAEAQHRGDESFNVVLIGSDSLDTVRTTHSSYFGAATEHLLSVVEHELSQPHAA